MSTSRLPLLDDVVLLTRALRSIGAVLSGESAAHLYLAAATSSRPGQPPRYSALPPQRIEAIVPAGAVEPPGVSSDRSAVADAVRPVLALFTRNVVLADGTEVPTLSREAVLAELLGRGGLAIGLAGTLMQLANDPPIEIDEVRELLKAARLSERFQPLLELVQIA
ncbi:MAG TPA: hypothetical protein VGJ84_22205 [Polyangiaceae bacterium]